jgi:hypothetical protein
MYIRRSIKRMTSEAILALIGVLFGAGSVGYLIISKLFTRKHDKAETENLETNSDVNRSTAQAHAYESLATTASTQADTSQLLLGLAKEQMQIQFSEIQLLKSQVAALIKDNEERTVTLKDTLKENADLLCQIKNLQEENKLLSDRITVLEGQLNDYLKKDPYDHGKTA